jgi:chromosome segregation protein
MLKLKKVQILGFKSFCDRTEVQLSGTGIAAVVGPNGCGKSNISDAITWVLGEQSAKSLRGIKMEDVIFAGTRDRKATGMAEVSLTLVDPEVYDAAPELVIDGEPAASGDWDETALRAEHAQETEEAVIDAQPGTTYEARVPKKRLKPLPENATPEELAAAAEAVEEDEEERGGHPDVHAELESETEEDLSGGEVESADEPGTPSTHSSITDGESGIQDAAASHNPNPGVVLKVRRRKFGRAPIRAGELTITRRLFRTGDSEYLLNGKICRLRDIQDIFMGTGLGGETYAIIGQERIGQLLSSKPLDRRGIIEEAAGITRFKTKKRLAELRLESAKQNLSRVNDIFEEVTRQLGSLKRQSVKAEKYQTIQTELRGKLRIVLASRLTQMDTEHATAAAEITRLTAAVDEQAAELETLDAEHSTGTARGYELDAQLREANARVSSAAVELERTATRLASNRDAIADLGARHAAAEAELASSHEQLALLAAEREQHRAFLETATGEANAARDAAGAATAAAQQATRDVISAEAVVEQQRHASMQAMQRAAQAQNEIAQAEAALAGLDRESERLEAEKQQAHGELQAIGQQRGQASIAFESVTERLKSLEAEIAELRRALDSKRQEETAARRHGDQLRAEMATLLGRRNSLDSLINEHSYSTDTVKNILSLSKKRNAGGSGGVSVNTLADFLEVEGRYESVVDEFLRDELNYIVVKSWDAAEEGMSMLRSDVAGRATFLVHPSTSSQDAFPFFDGMEATSNPQREGVVPLTDCVRVLNGFGRSLEVILPKLREGFVAPDNETARSLALSNPQSFFLSPSGETFSNVTVTGGRLRAQGPLALKRELAEVQLKLTAIEAELAQTELGTATLTREIAELNQTLETRNTARREAERESADSGAALRQTESEARRIESRLQNWELAAGRNRDQHRQREDAIGSRREAALQHEQKREEIEANLVEIAGKLGDMRTRREDLAATASSANAALAGIEERRRNADANFHQTSRLHDAQAARIAQIQSQLAAAIAERERREAEIVTLEARHTELTEQRTQATATVEELSAEGNTLRARLAELDTKLRTLRHETDALREQRAELTARSAKLTSDIEHLEATCLNDLAVAPADLRSDGSIARIEGEALSVEDDAARTLKARLEAMGPVNMMALEEYNETAERHSFLETQRKDLFDSIENTQASIKEIDDVSREKFEQAFAVINENFSTTFTKLFGGGQAFMRLTDEENKAESGIDIVASPPGKKLQNVLLLSGGEKALTALSLLVGIFQFQPAPFCVLDEVDAPLDETNVGRFVRMIAEMSTTTQFIVITHSKRTMEQADVMYGVTMQEPGVSKIVSVTLGGRQRSAGSGIAGQQLAA